MQKSCCVFFRSFSGFYVTSVLFAQKKPNFLWMAFLQWPRSLWNQQFWSILYFLICFSGLFLWMYISVKDNLFFFDSSFHFCPSILQRCPTTLLGYSFLPLFVMQIFQQQCSFLVAAPVSCRKPAIVFLQVLNVFFLLCCCQFLSLFHFNSCPLVLIFEPRNFENTGLTYIVECSRSIAVWWELNALYKSYKCY